MAKTATSPTPVLDARIGREPDLVDRIFDYLLAEVPELREHLAPVKVDQAKTAMRGEFAGQEHYIRQSDDVSGKVLSLFNGRNASEVARRLNISRATVYRKLKQPGAVQKKSQVSGK